MEIKCLYDKLVNPKSLKDNIKNRNRHGQDQIERLAELYKYHGVRHPIIVSNLSGMIVAGHGRKLAAIRAGIKEMPVVYQDFKDADAEYAFLISDNSIAEWSELDFSGINLDVENLGPDFNIDMLGIKDFTIDPSDKDKEEIQDEVPEPPKEPKSKLGDLYELGEHRLLCGDSTDKATVEILINGEKVDMVFTDPPYGMNLDTDYSQLKSDPTFKKEKGIIKDGNTYKQVTGDDKDFDPKFILSTFNYCKEIFLWGFDYYADKLPKGTPIVWDKREHADGSNLDGMYGSCFELCWSKAKHKRDIARIKWAMIYGIEKEFDKKRHHPTQKPIDLVLWFFNKWATDLVTVIDLFGGSGSTLIACEKTKRKCFMCELDPHYIDVIVSRYVKYTGNNKIKLNGKPIDWEIT